QPVSNAGGAQPPQRITGDALYVTSYNYVSKSIDHGQTWAIDTAGLNGVYLYSICTDTFQKVYLAANTGLLTQDANSDTWVLNSNYPATNCALVYVDKLNRLFAASGNM